MKTRPRRLLVTCSRRWLLLLGLAVAPVPRAWADEAVRGTWEGTYRCGQGDTALTLILRPAGDKGELDGLFHFRASPGNPGVPEGCFAMAGTYDGPGRELRLTAGRWILQPSGYVTVDLAGRLAPGGDRLSGQVNGPLCRGFQLRRMTARPGAVPSAYLGKAVIAALP